MIKLYFKSVFFSLFVFGLIVSLQGCGTVYYVGETTEATPIYASVDTTSRIIYTAPAGSKFLIREKKKKKYHIVYENYQGYLYSPVFSNYHKFNSAIDGNLYGYSTVKIKPTSRSNYSGSSSSSSSGGTVKVKGYYRKNGTYVRSHTRSSPRKR